MITNNVDVIIPCYNASRYLKNTLDSILLQSHKFCYIYAVDDGSTDDTLSILNEYKDIIKIICHPDLKNHGQSAALNLGIKQSSSEYIALMDSDDLWHPDKISKQLNVLEENKEVGLVYTNGYVIDSYGDKLYDLFESNHVEANIIGSILLNCYIRTPSMVMFRRKIIDYIGDFTLGITPDQDMWVRMHEKTKFYYLNEKLTYYRTHKNQLSQSNNKKMWVDAHIVLKSALKRYDYPYIIKLKRLAVINYRLGMYSLSKRTYIIAVYHFGISLLCDPLRALQYLTRFRNRI